MNSGRQPPGGAGGGGAAQLGSDVHSPELLKRPKPSLWSVHFPGVLQLHVGGGGGGGA